MILGRGTAQTDGAIIAEYHQFLHDTCQVKSSAVRQGFRGAPQVMRRRIGKPFGEWTDKDIVGLYNDRQKSACQMYNAFLAFFIFRGYYRPTLNLLTTLPVDLACQHRAALMPHRQRLERTRDELRYQPSTVGKELTLLIWLLAIAEKPLDELTRADLDAFRDEYQTWYQKTRQRVDGKPNYSLSRLERYLMHWGIVPEARVEFHHEEYLALLRHESIRQAILSYMQWCEARYEHSAIKERRRAVVGFFLWFQERYPDNARLAAVTRSVALEYAHHLKTKVEDGTYSSRYRNDLYRMIRLFFDFVIDEHLNTSPDHNPCARGDMPRIPISTPRYLSDHEVHAVLEYCNNDATLKERTVVITLLHTGIRAAELAALQVGDIVQIQGKWKLHIRQGKGLKDRIIPLTAQCLVVLQAWQKDGWERVDDHLFTRYGRPWSGGHPVCDTVREVGRKLGIRLTPHRFRHTFAVALLNYGIRESALQKLMGHKTLNMTLEYGRILDRTVEQAFNQAVERMQVGPLSWVPSFFASEDYTLFTAGDALNWIRLPHGYCRRNPRLHCESDTRCLLCDRFCALPSDLPRLQEMHDRFLELGMEIKANVVDSHIHQLRGPTSDSLSLEDVEIQCLQCFDEMSTQTDPLFPGSLPVPPT